MIISRKHAKAQGLKRYFTGKSCAHGHTAERQITNGCCVLCVSIALRASRKLRHEEFKKSQRAYAALHREKISSHARKHYNENKVVCLERHKKWRNDNPDKHRAVMTTCKNKRYASVLVENQNYRARRKNIEGFFTKEDVQQIYQEQNGVCVYCPTLLLSKTVGGKSNKTIDHKIPISKGGTNWLINLQLLCFSCNAKKNARSAEEYLKCLAA